MQIDPEALKALRLAARDTQADLAARAGVTVGTVQNLERGRSRGFGLTIAALARALDVSVDELTLTDVEQRAS